jgi:hypothetical protein
MQNPDSGHAERLDLAAGAKRPPHGGGFEASWKLSRTVLAENGRSPERAFHGATLRLTAHQFDGLVFAATSFNISIIVSTGTLSCARNGF